MKEQKWQACSVFEQKVMPIFGAMMPVSFFWPPVFRSFIGRGIRDFTKSLFVYFHPPIVLSTDLMNPLTNPMSLLSEVSNSCRTTPTNSSQKIQIKRQKKQCFNCPMSSLKTPVTKKNKQKKRYKLPEKTKLGSPLHDLRQI